MRRLAVPLVVLLLTAAVVVGLLQAGGRDEAEPFERGDLAAALESLEGAPAPLAALHAQSAEVLSGGFERRLRALRGHPIVINAWGSWCGPCRAEFPLLARQAAKHGRRVAFLGLNVGEGPEPGREFLSEFPVPYPSYSDRDRKLTDELAPGRATPTTVFLDRRGRVVKRHYGEYRSEEDLEAEIEEYAR